MSKGLEALQFMRERDMFLPSCASTIEQELKALEIINDNIDFQFLEKKENNQIRYIVRLINFDNPSHCFEWDMEKEKYDLLKEVLEK